MFRELDHDEHQFVASATLLARHGYLPYRDYPYFHVPYLVVIDALVFLVTDHLLMGARLLSIVSSAATVLLIASTISRWMRESALPLRRISMVAAVLVLLASPAFMATSGRAWNHDIPTLLAVIAFVIACRSSTEQRAGGRWFAIGALLGVATGVRLTFAPIAGAFFLALMTFEGVERARRRRSGLLFALGLTIALLPCTIMMVIAPRGFIFGNFQYPFLNMAFRGGEHYVRGVTPEGKLDFVLLDLLSKPGNLVALLFFVVPLAIGFKMHRRELNGHFDLRLLLLVVICSFIGALAATPLFPQYFFTPIVFMMLAGMAVVARITTTEKRRRQWKWAVALALIISVPSVVIGYRDVVRVAKWDDWVPIQVHERGVEVAKLAKNGPVLTLAPLFPLEGHAEIYPELATGPFAFRVGPYVEEANETRLKIWDPDNFASHLADRPPTLVLVGAEKSEEVPLIGYAQQHRTPIAQITPSFSMDRGTTKAIREKGLSWLYGFTRRPPQQHQICSP
jgi:hypothetical protein